MATNDIHIRLDRNDPDLVYFYAGRRRLLFSINADGAATPGPEVASSPEPEAWLSACRDYVTDWLRASPGQRLPLGLWRFLGRTGPVVSRAEWLARTTHPAFLREPDDEPTLNENLLLRIDEDLKRWTMAAGGSRFIRALLRDERERQAQQGPAVERSVVPE